ncbi:hypothetical protein GCM10022278_23580 [Allohahella marinimesophila]|uniref:Uncharacterized protein n=2 Tax=Allohahella marinimesophila TaxID=1054972 RepID=A0ABP7PGF6_9GAMM
MLLVTTTRVTNASDFCEHSNTNQLVWNEAFVAALHAFHGTTRASLFGRDELLVEQALTGLGGPPDRIRTLSEGLVMASACRADSCTEKAAVVLSCPDTIEAVGVLHYRCGSADDWQVCPDEPVLSVYLHRQPGSRIASDALKAWAINSVPKARLPLSYDYRDQFNELQDPPPDPGAGALR